MWQGVIFPFLRRGMSSLNHLQFQELPLWSLSLWFSLSSLPGPCWKMQLQKTKKWVSHSAVCPGLSALGGLRDLPSALLVLSSFVPKSTLRFPKSCSMKLVELEEHVGSKPAWGSPLGVGWRILWKPEVGVLLWISGFMWLTLIENSSVYCSYILFMLVASSFPYASKGLMWRPP